MWPPQQEHGHPTTAAQRFDPERTAQPARPQDELKARGKLTVFLGYAAGVGKTCAMLEGAQQRLSEGIDVVVGCVETHAQADLEALLAGLETCPPRQLDYQGHAFLELDVDALLARQPAIALVDDLAHLNAPGSRHVHRYQDVLELLNGGLDVHATLSIQHLESLNDVVSRVTGITVQETIPDFVLDEADEVRLVDLPVGDLLARLDAGKIQAVNLSDKNLRQFFRPGNLMALREMALRYTANRVDEQMRAYMRAHAISGPWPAGDRLLVCVGPSPLSERLVRTTSRLARRLDAEWIAAYVETPGQANLPDAVVGRIAETLRLAEQLGAQAVRLAGHSVAETLAEYALSRNVTKLVAGKPLRPRWREWLHGSIIDQILAHSQGIDVYVISGKAEIVPTDRHPRSDGWRTASWRAYALGVALVLLATIMGLPFRLSVNPTNLVMLYLAAVMVAAVRLGRRPAIVASLLSVIVFDIVFVPPYYTFVVADAEYLLTFAGLLAVGLVISTLVARAQEQANAARRREAQTAALYDLSQGLAASSDLGEMAEAIVSHAKTAFRSPVALFLREEADSLKPLASTADFYPEAEVDAVVDWVYRHRQPAGRHTETMPRADGHYLPLQVSGEMLGVLAIALPEDSQSLVSGDQRRFLTSFANQVALALEKARLTEEARRAHLLDETEKLQTTLLNAISHDLRTPLATITGALSSLHDDAELLSEAAQRELVYAAWEEALRLNRLVGNLLDMTRLESGAMKVVRQAYDVQELVGATLAHMPNRLQGRLVKRRVPNDLPPVAIDLSLMIQALMNLIDNAVKYAPPEQPIEIEAYQEQASVVVAVKDRGPGLAETELERVFSKFYRLSPGGIGGTGLGLSIAKGIVEAHGGRIWAQNRPEGGADFRFALPLAEGLPPEDTGAV